MKISTFSGSHARPTGCGYDAVNSPETSPRHKDGVTQGEREHCGPIPPPHLWTSWLWHLSLPLERAPLLNIDDVTPAQQQLDDPFWDTQETPYICSDPKEALHGADWEMRCQAHTADVRRTKGVIQAQRSDSSLSGPADHLTWLHLLCVNHWLKVTKRSKQTGKGRWQSAAMGVGPEDVHESHTCAAKWLMQWGH